MKIDQASHPANFLRLCLRGNALFSSLSGLAFILASERVAAMLGDVPEIWVGAVGFQLLLFAGALLWLASRAVVSVSLAIGVIVADMLWVVATAAIVYADLLASDGQILALALADIVLVMAVLQSIGVRRILAAAIEVDVRP